MPKRVEFDTIQSKSFVAGKAAMVLLVIATFMPGGSLSQKVSYLVGASVLLGVAIINNLILYKALQSMIVAGSILSFLPISIFFRSLLLGCVGVLALIYLIIMKIHKRERWWPIGAAGLVLISIGFMNVGEYALLVNSCIALGGILLTVYAGLDYFIGKVRASLIWFILNAVFAFNPARLVIMHFLGN